MFEHRRQYTFRHAPGEYGHHESGSLGDRGDGLTTEVWWTPSHPFKSSLTGQSAKQLADSWTATSKRQWTQPLGFVHALFEVAIDTLQRSKNLSDPKSILQAIAATNLNTIVGPVKWPGPVKNVSKTPLVAGQWVKKGKTFELVVTANKNSPIIPIGGKTRSL